MNLACVYLIYRQQYVYAINWERLNWLVPSVAINKHIHFVNPRVW
jgi:hypothetical protein